MNKSLPLNMFTKVPEITAYFWITKVLTTGMGEVFSDYLVNHMDPVLAVALAFAGLIVSLVLQFRADRYVAWIYWLVVVMVSIFGTMAADFMHVVVGIPYIVSTSFFAIVLAAIFIFWYATREDTVHSQYLYPFSRNALLGCCAGNLCTWYCCRRHDGIDNETGLFLRWSGFCRLTCYSSIGLLVI